MSRPIARLQGANLVFALPSAGCSSYGYLWRTAVTLGGVFNQNLHTFILTKTAD